jgi:Tfp pilus assembly protein PilV
MRALRNQRGTTLIEAMIAMVVLLVGAVGVMGAHRQGLRLASDARRITRASAIAQDLVDQISLWPYGDPRLADTIANDAIIGDPGQAFETTADASSLADFGETPSGTTINGGLTASGTTWNGIPSSVLSSYSPPFERYWNVAYDTDVDGDGVPDAVRIAVIVRWGDPQSGYRRIVSFAAKANPQPTP